MRASLAEPLGRVFAEGEATAERLCEALRAELDVRFVWAYERSSSHYRLECAVERKQEVARAANEGVYSAGKLPVVEPPDVGAEPTDEGLEPPASLPLTDVLRQPGLWQGMGELLVALPTGRSLLLFGPYRRPRVARGDLARATASVHAIGALLDAARRESALRRELALCERRVESTADAMSSSLDTGALLATLIRQAARTSRHSAAFVALEEGEGWRLETDYELPEAFRDAEETAGVGALFEASRIDGTWVGVPRDELTLARFGVRTLLLLPLESGSEVVGVLGLVNRTADEQAALDYEVMAGFAQQVALVVGRTHEVEKFSRAYAETLETLCRGLDLARGCPGHHAEVAAFASSLARVMGHSEEEIELVHRAGQLHDIGLVPGARTPGDVQIEFQHPALGAALLHPLRDGARLARIVAEHHETHDGFGFPDAREGGELSSMGRILAVAEWVTERRRGNAIAPAASDGEVAVSIREQAGSRFESTVANAAASLLETPTLRVMSPPAEEP